MNDNKEHWENIYKSKKLTEMSWYQPKPETSLTFITELGLDKDDGIIDIGGGDSFLADFLLAEGYTNVTVLDISEEAVNRAKQRLGDKARQVKWIVADAANFTAAGEYRLWHDRAAFHFLNDDREIEEYLATLKKTISPGGYAIIGTFSKQGPSKCSGIPVRQYSAEDLKAVIPDSFKNLTCKNIDHTTPGGNIQKFIFCLFTKTQ